MWSDRLDQQVVCCRLCRRLTAYREQVAREKKREFRDWDYWGKPVPSFGDPNARLLIVGLAPAAHGANRTGRMFTGDQSGRWLYRALHKAGLAASAAWQHRGDGQQLRDCYITAVIHCAPPGNKPLPAEIAHCSRYFEEELRRLARVRVVVALGQIAFNHYLNIVGISPRPKFAHGAVYHLGGVGGTAYLISVRRRSPDRAVESTAGLPIPVAGDLRSGLVRGRETCAQLQGTLNRHGTEPSRSGIGGRSESLRTAGSMPVLIASYHPSRQNTNTGKLTEPMLDTVFEKVRAHL